MHSILSQDFIINFEKATATTTNNNNHDNYYHYYYILVWSTRQ